MTDKVKSALATLELNRSFCDLQVAGAITNLLEALEDADNVNISEEHKMAGRPAV